jgi:flagellar operon protein
MSPIRSVGGPSVPAYERLTPETAPGFGDTLDALLRPPRPIDDGRAASAPRPTDGTIQFSRHAQARMESRGIHLDADDLADLGTAVDKLAQRGAKESLVLLGDHAFIVGVPDRKIVTALTRQEAAGTIFTQIDSTAVVR